MFKCEVETWFTKVFFYFLVEVGYEKRAHEQIEFLYTLQKHSKQASLLISENYFNCLIVIAVHYTSISDHDKELGS